MTQKPRAFNATARKVLVLTTMSFGIASGVHAQVENTGAATPSTKQLSVANAPVTPTTMRPDNATFDKVDTNKDGQLSPAEAKSLPSVFQQFRQLDINKDKMLSRSEFSKATPVR